LTRIYEAIPSFSGVSSPGTASRSLRLTDTYESIHINYQESAANVTVANMKTAIERIRVILNGKTQIELTYTELEARNAAWGYTAKDGWIEIYLGLPSVFDPLTRLLAGWGMSDVSSFDIEIQVASGRVAPTIPSAYAVKFPVEGPIGNILRMGKTTITPSGTGDVPMDTLPTNQGDYVAIHHETANINYLTTKLNGRAIIDGMSRTELGNWLSDSDWFVQQAGWTQLLFVGTRSFADRLGMTVVENGRAREVEDFRHTPNMSVGTQHDVIYELWGEPV